MAITYTESWAQSFGEDTDTREVSIEYHVVSDDAVLTSWNYKTATHATSGAAFPIKGQPRLEDPRYRLHRFSSPQFEGPRYARVQTVWKVGPFGGTETEDDPLSAPVRYRFRPVTNSETTDADANGNFLLNSAGDVLTAEGHYNSYVLEAIRNESVFDPAFAVALHNRVNQSTLQIVGKTLQPGEALCTGIFPENEWTLQDEYVPVVYQFEVRDRYRLFSGNRVTAFSHRMLDQGRRGWIHGPRKVAIHHRNGDIPNPTPVGEDVLLDLGVPLGEPDEGGRDWWSVDPDFAPDVGKGWEPNMQVLVPPLLAIDKDPDTKATWLYYARYAETDMSGLNL